MRDQWQPTPELNVRQEAVAIVRRVDGEPEPGFFGNLAYRWRIRQTEGWIRDQVRAAQGPTPIGDVVRGGFGLATELSGATR